MNKLKEINEWLQIELNKTNKGFFHKGKRYPSYALDDVKKITYFKSGKKGQKVAKINPFSTNDRRYQAIMQKPGKFFKAVCPDASPADIQSLVSRYYAKIHTIFDSSFTFEVTDDIKKYYHENTYDKFSGNLGYSCMRHSECQPYMDFYDNYNVKLLVLINKSTDKITGRALLWDIVYNDNKKQLLDRVYVSNDNDFILFKNYCREHNIIIRNDYDSFSLGSKNFQKEFIIAPIDPDVNQTTAPYLDTFMFFDDNTNELSNFDFRECISLDSTEGRIYNNRCAACEEYDDGLCFVTGVGYVCNECLDGYYYCNVCGNYHTSINSLDGENICDRCLEIHCTECPECGELFRNSMMYSHSNKKYCSDCYMKLKSACNCCGLVVLAQHMHSNYDYSLCKYMYVCDDCYSHRSGPFQTKAIANTSLATVVQDNSSVIGIELPARPAGEPVQQISTQIVRARAAVNRRIDFEELGVDITIRD